MNSVRVVFKAVMLLILLNIFFALFNPLDAIGELSIYNRLVPGRVRLPYGEDPAAYNLSLNSLSAMFASHEIARPKTPDEFRVVVIGDSSVWGILLQPSETLTATLNRTTMTLANNQQVVAYNLGHPILSLTKDLLLLDVALQYDPDLIIWLVTLRSFPRTKQFDAPLVQNNAEKVKQLFTTLNLNYDLTDARLADPEFLNRTIIGQRRPLADWLRLQLFGVMWSITGIDQIYPDEIMLRTSDFEVNNSWNDDDEPRPLTVDELAFDIIHAGHNLVKDIPLMIVNEPIFISDGENSDLRYNLWYPRWAYDGYLDLLKAEAVDAGWEYVDLWDFIDHDEFTDSPVHLSPAGSHRLATRLSQEIVWFSNERINNG